ncbi:hypothetical protein D5S18_00975 [Nocardia panacis]|uniref:Tetratricopeptide repeat protein n=1 Tax=Nocardia panacis TaxID=2340916 RepID=A0A3A4KTK9_9NOCA|nr:hypothetical protein D5S18_00975 [Nocardia panacis]
MAVLADALDRWSARLGREPDTELTQAVSRLTADPEFAIEHELAEIRAGAPALRSRVAPLHRYAAALRARRTHREALRLSEPNPDAAQRLLDQAWRQSPRADIAGRMCVLIDLAVLHLRGMRLDAALHCLRSAEELTADGRDPAGRARMYETAAALFWTRGEHRRALRHWQSALVGYRDLDHALGISRCLQHLAGAALIDTSYGGLLLDGTSNLTHTEVLRQITGWLAEALRLRPDVPRDGELLAERYLADANRRLAAPSPQPRQALTAIDRWPLPHTR